MADPTSQEKNYSRQLKNPQLDTDNYSDIKSNSGQNQAGSSSVSIGDEAETRRRLGKEKLQAKKENAKAAGAAIGGTVGQRFSGSGGRMAGEKAEEEVGGSVAERSIAGRWNRLKNQQQKNKAALNKIKAGSLTGTAATEAANQAVRRGWTAIHEFLEDTSLSFIDFMILSGPLTIIVLVGRFFGALIFSDVFTIKIKGIKVSMLPQLSAAEAALRVSKTFLIALIIGLEWLLIYGIIYLYSTVPDWATYLTPFKFWGFMTDLFL